MKDTEWLPHVAVSHYSNAKTEYEFPCVCANVIGDSAQFTADAIQFGFSVYEGLRVHIVDGMYTIFRCRDHHERMAQSCAALDLPCPDYETFVAAIRLVVERNYQIGIRSLYIRPIVFAAGGGIMPKQAQQFTFAVACAEFNHAMENLSVLIDTKNIRTVPGFSSIKTATNYTNSFLATRRAQRDGYDTILWCDSDGYIQECSTMNIFFYVKDEIWTPSLGSILPGVTRRTVIELLALQHDRVFEKRIHVIELLKCIERGDVTYAFTTSTALGVIGVSSIGHNEGRFRLGEECPRKIKAAMENHKMLLQDGSIKSELHRNIRERSFLGAL
jgi:branched-chain amino acid aminotransferase